MARADLPRARRDPRAAQRSLRTAFESPARIGGRGPGTVGRRSGRRPIRPGRGRCWTRRSTGCGSLAKRGASRQRPADRQPDGGTPTLGRADRPRSSRGAALAGGVLPRPAVPVRVPESVAGAGRPGGPRRAVRPRDGRGHHRARPGPHAGAAHRRVRFLLPAVHRHQGPGRSTTPGPSPRWCGTCPHRRGRFRSRGTAGRARASTRKSGWRRPRRSACRRTSDIGRSSAAISDPSHSGRCADRVRGPLSPLKEPR